MENIGIHPIFSDFEVFNPKTDKTYKVAVRSENPSMDFCSCPDFKINTLGTCKHIEYVLYQLKRKKSNNIQIKQGYKPKYSSISLQYGKQRKVYFRIGENNKEQLLQAARPFFDDQSYLRIDSVGNFEQFVQEAVIIDPEFRCYQDAVDYIIEIRDRLQRELIPDQHFNLGINSPELDNLLKTHLYPYQKEGILFAAKAGRCLIADDMGLGNTIQAFGTTGASK